MLGYCIRTRNELANLSFKAAGARRFYPVTTLSNTAFVSGTRARRVSRQSHLMFQ